MSTSEVFKFFLQYLDMAKLSEDAQLVIGFVNENPPGYHTRFSVIGRLRYYYIDNERNEPGLRSARASAQEAIDSGKIVEIGTGMLKVLYPKNCEG